VTVICVLCTLCAQISPSICNFTHNSAAAPPGGEGPEFIGAAVVSLRAFVASRASAANLDFKLLDSHGTPINVRGASAFVTFICFLHPAHANLTINSPFPSPKWHRVTARACTQRRRSFVLFALCARNSHN
jgi:hypothetical protein